MMKFSQKSLNSNYNLKTSKKRENSVEDFDVYGKDLKMLMDLSQSKEIPDLIFIFGYFIKNYGLLVQGIFRVSGNKTRMEDIKSNYVHRKIIEINFDDIHNITGLYKMFLREIPGGLIPYTQAIDLIKATKMHKKNDNLDLITEELLKLSVPHYNLLKFTCSLLSLVCKCSSSNLMSSDNLGTVFGPTFFASIEDISLLSMANTLTSILIQNYHELFKVSAPIHTNLNQFNETGTKFETVPNTTGSNVSKYSKDQNVTIKFGESFLSINISNDMENFFPNTTSIVEEEPLPFSDKQESLNNSNNPSITNPQFSNSLALALQMCVNNHLFDQFVPVELNINNDQLSQPSSLLISNCMLNGYNPMRTFQPSHCQQFKNSTAPPGVLYTTNDHRVDSAPSGTGDKKRNHLDNTKHLSLSRRINNNNNTTSLQHNYEMTTATNHKTLDQPIALRQDNFSSLNKYPIQKEVTNQHERPLSQVPQLDLSVFKEPYETEDNKSFPTKINPTDKLVNNNRQQQQQYPPKLNNNVRQTIHESKILEADSNVSQLQKRRSVLKSQLQQFENSYLSSNEVKPDKCVKLNNEWHQKIANDPKTFSNSDKGSIDKIKDMESDSIRGVKKKPVSGSGDVITDPRFVAVTPIDNRSAGSRPVSVLSESTVKVSITNESARSNTLNSYTTTNLIIEDLSPRECENLKMTLCQISNHLREERIRDNRPEDLDLMTPEQVECEKVTMQKALLNFESVYGRKKNPNAIQLMKPLYDRYRQVKKLLSQNAELLGSRLVPRTLDNRPKSNTVYQYAWTNEKHLPAPTPLSTATVLQTGSGSNYTSPSHTNNIDVIMPSNIQFDNSDLVGEESVSVGPNRQDFKISSQQQNQKRSSNTFQYRKSNVPTSSPNDYNNNDSHYQHQHQQHHQQQQQYHHNDNNNYGISSQLTRDDLKAEYQKLARDKKELQRILKDFENNFERETKRKVEKSDRLPMEREYARYKMIKNRIKELEEFFENSMP